MKSRTVLCAAGILWALPAWAGTPQTTVLKCPTVLVQIPQITFYYSGPQGSPLPSEKDFVNLPTWNGSPPRWTMTCRPWVASATGNLACLYSFARYSSLQPHALYRKPPAGSTCKASEGSCGFVCTKKPTPVQRTKTVLRPVPPR